MQEAFSLAGMTESPVLFILSSRPGPSTGVPTYTEQADVQFALHQGHGDFPRIVASPGTVADAFYLASELLNLVWKFQTPGILLTEKHLAESRMTVNINPENTEWAMPAMYQGKHYARYQDTKNGVSPLKFPPSKAVIKWNSYEHDEQGITTEKPTLLAKMHEKRKRKMNSLINHMKTKRTTTVYGKGEPVFITLGSTTMSVLEAVTAAKLKATIIQLRYLMPFPIWDFKGIKGKNVVVIEQSSTGQLANLIQERTGLEIRANITKYDGRPFEPIELSESLKEVL
jgi:2-oxoglutarate ferredoxin oxidoreductase subunit alpha